MTDTTASAAAKVKTVNEDMAQRRTFKDTTSALAYITKCANEISDFDPDKVPFITHGFGPQGESGELGFDPTVYPDGYDVMVATLSEKGTKEAKGKVSAIIITPIPSLDTFLATDGGKEWVSKIIEKEANLVAVRPIRNKADMLVKADEMPKTAAEFIAGGREGTSGLMEAFETLFKRIKDGMTKQHAIWGKANLPKAELKKAFSSLSYAADYYPALEVRADGKDSLFVVALKVGAIMAKREGLDPAIFEKWLATRDSFDIEAQAEADQDAEDQELDADAIAALMMADDKPAETADATTEATQEPATAEQPAE
jgi:hypothetical protein